MISSNQFFRLGKNEMYNYLYDRFPASVSTVPIEGPIDYTNRIKNILGISGHFYTIYHLRYKNSKLAKKGEVFIYPQRIETIEDRIEIESCCYKIKITITGIYECEPVIKIIEGNK